MKIQNMEQLVVIAKYVLYIIVILVGFFATHLEMEQKKAPEEDKKDYNASIFLNKLIIIMATIAIVVLTLKY